MRFIGQETNNHSIMAKTISDIQLIQTVLVPLVDLAPNVGQIPGVPSNPREIKKDDYRKLKKSIQENPEMLALREMIVYEHGGKYVVLAGNHRLKALIELGEEVAPVKICPPDSTPEWLMKVVLLDGAQYARYDMDELANKWSWKLIEMANIKIKGVTDVEKDDEGDEPGTEKFTEILNEEHNYVVLYFDNGVDWLQAQTLLGIQSVRCLSTAEGKENMNAHKYGIGRVLDGAKALNRILGNANKIGGKKK